MDSVVDQQVKDNQLLQAHAHVWKYCFSYISSMCLKCVVQLSIPEIIHNHGKPMSLSSLVEALSLPPPSKTEAVNRLMRFLIHAGFFTTQKLDENQENEKEGFLLTPSSRCLIKDDSNTLSSIVLAMVDPVLVTPLFSLSDWFQGNGSTTFEAGQGMGFWNFLEHNPDYGKNFNYAMANDSRLMMSVIVNEGKAVFENLKSLVDVGGGNGTSAKAIVEAFPDLKCLVLDLPHVVADHLPKSTTNLGYIGGNMFEFIPSSNAVLMKHILHDWSDSDCVKILKRCREAIPSKEEGGKVILIESVMMDRKQEHDSTEIQLLFDMMMLAVVGGKERTEKQWKKLFLESGFTDYKITPLSGFKSVIEVYP